MKTSNIGNSHSAGVDLRGYQIEAVARALECLTAGSRNMVVMPTGAGKSLVIAEITKSRPDLQILIITPRKRLLNQLLPILGLHGVLSAGMGDDLGYDHYMIAGTFQTMLRRPNLKAPNVIIIDECHLLPPNSKYLKLLGEYPQAAVLGFTATPYRGRSPITVLGLGLGWKQIFSVSMTDLIAKRHLVPPVSMATGEAHFADDMDGRTRDDVTREIVPILTAAVATKHRKRCLVFCTNIEHAKLTQKLLQKAGEHAVYLVHSDLSQKEQDKQFWAFENSKKPAWLVNVGIVTLGVDIPSIDCIAILRGITSFSLLVQIIGRGLRTWEGKTDCLIYDFGHGTRRFGFIDDPDFGDVRNGTQTFPFKSCPGCGKLLHWSAMCCTHCNHEFPRKTSLHGNALQVQLLSHNYVMAKYIGCVQTKDIRVSHKLEHQFTFDGHTLRALEFSRKIPTLGRNEFNVGDLVMVKRLENDIVKIIRSKSNAQPSAVVHVSR